MDSIGNPGVGQTESLGAVLQQDLLVGFIEKRGTS